MKEVIIILPFFHVGGVERWSLNTINALNKQGFKGRIVVLGKVTASVSAFGPSFPQNDCIIETGFIELVKALFGKNVIIISALTKLNFFLSLFGYLFSRTVISSIHLSVDKKDFESSAKYIIRRAIHYLIIYFSTKIICVSDGIRMEMERINPKRSNKCIAIYNPCFNEIDIQESKFKRSLRRNSQYESRDRFINIVAAGRLHYQKGFDLLIQVFINIGIFALDNVMLNIYGEGEELERLKNMIPQELKSRIIINKFSNNLMNVLQGADIFVLSSRYEGFGNVLAEALAAGCYCISFDVKHGPREILNNGRFGTLVPSNDLSQLKTVIEDQINYLKIFKTYGDDLDGQLLHAKLFTVESFGNSICSLLRQID